MNESYDYLVVGAGVPGLITAKYLKLKNSKSRIAIVDFSDEVGGLYKSEFISDLNVWVDFGMHIYYESGIEDFDSIIKEVLSTEKWNILSGNKKDIAGIFWRGELIKSHPYPDLRNEPIQKKTIYIARLISLAILSKFSRNTPENAKEYAKRHFGSTIYEEVIKPILEKLYVSNPKDLNSVSLISPELRRVAITNEWFTKKLSFFKSLRLRLAYPSQFSMPFQRDRIQSGYYPKESGFGHQVLTPLYNDLHNLGIDLFLSSRVSSILKVDKNLEVKIDTKSKEKTLTIGKIIWTASVLPLIQLLSLPIKKSPQIMSHKKKIFFVALLKGENTISPLYYFYVYDKNFSTFRVTNYKEYTNFSNLEFDQYLLGIEFWVDADKQNNDTIENVSKELYNLGILKNSQIVKICRMSDMPHPPEPTNNNVNFIREIQEAVSDTRYRENLVLSGPFLEGNDFFLQDILRTLKQKLDLRG
jgi:protoporphyrinogen oxidase